jgi:hypothetical protein
MLFNEVFIPIDKNVRLILKILFFKMLINNIIHLNLTS